MHSVLPGFGMMIWLKGTLIVIPVKIKSTVMPLEAREQSRYGRSLLTTAPKFDQIDCASVSGKEIRVVPVSSKAGPGVEPPFRMTVFPFALVICTPCRVTKNCRT
jgi:hypothetical protein